MEDSKLHISFFSSPGMGHLIPIIELSKRLVIHKNFKVTIFSVSSYESKAESEIITSALAEGLKDFNIIRLPLVDISNKLSEDSTVVTKIIAMMHGALTPLHAAITDMAQKPSVLIVDIGFDAFDIANEFGMLKLVYLPWPAWFVSYFLYAFNPKFDKDSFERDVPIKIPGCKSLMPENAGSVLWDPNSPFFEYNLTFTKGILSGEGILINTWKDLEPQTLKSMVDYELMGKIIQKPIYAIGPIVRPPSGPTPFKSECEDWLDMQSMDSVIYVSFGSAGILSAKQTIELAHGLEQSRHKFIWVFRPPAKEEDERYLSAGNRSDDPSSYLPDGFLDRTKSTCILIPGWAPQVKILAHQAVGGFLSHCGWNSTQESLVNGKPMITWPLFAEQTMNAALLVEDLKIGVRPREWPAKGIIMRDEVEEMVKKVMDESGDTLRIRAKEIKVGADAAWKKGGSSYESLYQLAKDCEEWNNKHLKEEGDQEAFKNMKDEEK